MPLNDPEALARVGARLRARREELGLTLDQLSEATTIRVHYLNAIEAGEPDKLPGEAYLKGFVRVYAERVGLDGGRLLHDEDPDEPVSGPPPTRRLSARHRHGRRPTRRTWIVGIAVAVVLAIVALHHGSPRAKPVAAAHPPQAVKHKPAAPVKTQLTVEPVGVSGGVVSYRVTGTSTIIVQAHTTGSCWVSVHADGKPVLTRTLKSGRSLMWHAQHELTVDVGDFATIRLTVDGIPLGRLHYRSPSTLDFRLAAATTG